jgi:hypothetical protein
MRQLDGGFWINGRLQPHVPNSTAIMDGRTTRGKE